MQVKKSRVALNLKNIFCRVPTQAREHIDGGVRHDGMMSTSVVLECQAGSEVWVQGAEIGNNDCFVYGDFHYQYSSFGGFMLQTPA